MTAGRDAGTVVVGAGPYGLAVAAELARRAVPFRILGKPMETWAERMPDGMLLKSEGFASSIGSETSVTSLRRYCRDHGISYDDVGTPVRRETFLAYGRAVQRLVAPDVEEDQVVLLERAGDGFALELAGGGRLRAGSVVVATGLTDYAHIPNELQGLAPLVTHSSAHRDLSVFCGRRVAVVGAGQSALESAALLLEAGAGPLLVARTPRLAWNPPPDPGTRSSLRRALQPRSGIGRGWRAWTAEEAPHLFRYLPIERRLPLALRTLGPAGAWWLRPRLEGKLPVLLGHHVVGAEKRDSGIRLRVAAGGVEQALDVDHVIAATGYRVNLERLPFLGRSVRDTLRVLCGAPWLSPWFESSVPSLFFAGFAATVMFGPSMRFVCGSGFSGRRIAAAVAAAAPRRRIAHRRETADQAVPRRHLPAEDRLVLCYHAVSDDWISYLAVRPAALDAQLRYLADHGYRSVTFNELVTERPGGRVVSITFDDGYRSLLAQALPILERHRMVATLFALTDYADSGAVASWPGMERWLGGSQEQHLALLTWDGLRQLAAAGWEVGSHTRSHRRLRDLGAVELDFELRGSRLEIEDHLQRACRSLAYPYGSPGVDIDGRTAAAAAGAGYTAAATVPRRLWPVEPLLWPRVTIGAADSLATFRAKVSPAVRRLRAGGMWPAVDAPRRFVRDHALAAAEARRLRAVEEGAVEAPTLESVLRGRLPGAGEGLPRESVRRPSGD